MAIKPELVEYVRATVRGERELSDEIEAQLDAEGWDGLARLLAALFFITVDHRFNDKSNSAEVIQFVADLRSEMVDGGPEIDPAAAETLIKSIIDPSVKYNIDAEMIGRIQAAVSYKVLHDEDLTDEQLDDILSEAMGFASRPL